MRVREEKDAPPSCPFCGAPLKRPEQMRITSTDSVPGGKCSCGALYLSDPTAATVVEGVAGGSNATASAPTRIVTLNALRNGLPK